MLSDDQLRLLLYPRLLEFGVSYGDLLSIEDSLEQGGFEAWSRAIFALAECYADRALKGERDGCLESAASFYRRACDYYHFAGFRTASLDLSREACLRSKACFEAWRRCARPALIVEQIQCLGESVTIHASGWRGKRLVILIGGLDSSKECELWYFSRHFASRGMDVVYADFPGQGELLGRLAIVEHGDTYARALLEVIRRRAAAASLAVFGVSLGGYLALRVAALCQSIAATVSLGGFFDSAVFANLRPEAKPHLRQALTLDPHARLENLSEGVSLAGASERLDTPALIIHGEKDHLVPLTQVRAIVEWAPKAIVRFVEGAEHVATSRFPSILPEMADWTRSRLNNAH